MTRLLSAVPAAPAVPVEIEPAAAPETPAADKPKRQPRARKTVTQPPAEQKPAGTYDRRIPFMTDDEQFRALKTARAEDDVEATTRLRAMVKIWMTDKKFRAAVDEMAKADRLKERVARGYRR